MFCFGIGGDDTGLDRQPERVLQRTRDERGVALLVMGFARAQHRDLAVRLAGRVRPLPQRGRGGKSTNISGRRSSTALSNSKSCQPAELREPRNVPSIAASNCGWREKQFIR